LPARQVEVASWKACTTLRDELLPAGADWLHPIDSEGPGLTRGVEANLVQHPPKIDQATDFRVTTAQPGDSVRHQLNSLREKILPTEILCR